MSESTGVRYSEGEMDWQHEGPQIVKRGRLHAVVLHCFVPDAVTADQIEEYIGYELGYGSISNNNPLLCNGVDVASITHAQDTGKVGYTLWDAKGEQESGKRYGQNVIRDAGEPIGAIYKPVEEVATND